MASIQLELFEISEMDKLRNEIRGLEESIGNVRRGMFSRLNELEQKLKKEREDRERLEAQVLSNKHP